MHDVSRSLFTVGLNHYLVLSFILFGIGILGVLIRKNLLVLLMSIELMLNAVNLIFVAFSKSGASLDGQMVVFFVIAVAAAEAAVGLALLVLIFRHFKTLNIRILERLRG